MYWIIVAIPPILYMYYVHVYERRNEVSTNNNEVINQEPSGITTYRIPTRIKSLFFDCIVSTLITYVIGLIINFILKEN